MLVSCDDMIAWCRQAFFPELRLLRQTVEADIIIKPQQAAATSSVVNRKRKWLGLFNVFLVENVGRFSVLVCFRGFHTYM